MQIETIYGPMDEDQLKRVDTVDEDDDATYSAVEYYLGTELVHRSAHVALKRGFNMDFLTERLG